MKGSNNMAKNTLEKTKMFKAGNSYALRLTKEDRKLLHADNNTIFEKRSVQMVILLHFRS